MQCLFNYLVQLLLRLPEVVHGLVLGAGAALLLLLQQLVVRLAQVLVRRLELVALGKLLAKAARGRAERKLPPAKLRHVGVSNHNSGI